MITGYDVSHWQTTDTLKRAIEERKTDFVWIKASEGKNFIDDKAVDHFKTANDMGVPVIGFYHYARAEKNKATPEAKNFVDAVRQIAGLNAHVMLALDFEDKAFACEDCDKWALAFCDYVYTETDVKPLLYTSYSRLSHFPSLPAKDYGLWVAKWSAYKPKDVSPWPFWAFWQRGKQTIYGKEVDDDVFNGSVDQCRKYAGY